MQTEIHTYIPTFICFPPGQQRGVSPASFAADRHPQPLAWDQTFTGSPFPGSNYIYIYYVDIHLQIHINLPQGNND